MTCGIKEAPELVGGGGGGGCNSFEEKKVPTSQPSTICLKAIFFEYSVRPHSVLLNMKKKWTETENKTSSYLTRRNHNPNTTGDKSMAPCLISRDIGASSQAQLEFLAKWRMELAWWGVGVGDVTPQCVQREMCRISRAAGRELTAPLLLQPIAM